MATGSRRQNLNPEHQDWKEDRPRVRQVIAGFTKSQLELGVGQLQIQGLLEKVFEKLGP